MIPSLIQHNTSCHSCSSIMIQPAAAPYNLQCNLNSSASKLTVRPSHAVRLLLRPVHGMQYSTCHDVLLHGARGCFHRPANSFAAFAASNAFHPHAAFISTGTLCSQRQEKIKARDSCESRSQAVPSNPDSKPQVLLEAHSIYATVFYLDMHTLSCGGGLPCVDALTLPVFETACWLFLKTHLQASPHVTAEMCNHR
jgi:hypothetical protein